MVKQREHVEVGGLRERVGELQLRTDMLDLDDAESDGIANEVCAQVVVARIAVRRTRRGADGRA